MSHIYKMFTFIKYQQQIPKASKLVRGSFRHYANYIPARGKLTETFEEPGSGCLTRSHKSAILFISN